MAAVGAGHGEGSAGAHAALISSAPWLASALSTACGAAERVPPRRQAGKHASGRQAGTAAAALRLWVSPRQRLPTGCACGGHVNTALHARVACGGHENTALHARVACGGMSTQDCRLGWPGSGSGVGVSGRAGPALSCTFPAPCPPAIPCLAVLSLQRGSPCCPAHHLFGAMPVDTFSHSHSNLTVSQYQHRFSNPVPNFCAATLSRQ